MSTLFYNIVSVLILKLVVVYVFVKVNNIVRPIGQEVKTTPSHGVNPGSIPGLVIKGGVTK